MQQAADEHIGVMQSMTEEGDIDCSNYVEQLEEAGQTIRNYLVNIDMTNTQCEVDTLLEQAEKLGMDFGDLEEYGLDVKSGACGGKTCLDREKFKRYD